MALKSLVLAGGASARMGRDKALLAYDGEPQVRRLVRLLEALVPPAYVSVRAAQTADPGFAGLRLLPDQDQDIGPLAGVLSAFREDPTSAWLVVAVDMPFLTEATLRQLLDCRNPEAYATAFRNPEIGQPEPVCTIYEPRILPALLSARARGRYTLRILRDLEVRLVEPARPDELANINEPEEYRRALEAKKVDRARERS
jgi:molybdopterin-guanine dinucleotide biosynthesis protein A